MREATADGLGRVSTLSQALTAYVVDVKSGAEPRRSLRDHASAADG